MSDKPEVKAGWYPDPAGSATRRWWDGSAWGDLEVVEREAGWYPDPDGGPRRYWDGSAWGDPEKTVPAGWYVDQTSGRYRYWDGVDYDDSKVRGTLRARKVVAGGGTLAKYGGNISARARLWIIVGVVVVVVGLGAFLLKGSGGGSTTTTTSSTTTTLVPKVLNPLQGTMYGSTQGLLKADHLPGGVTRFVCINGTSHVVEPDRAMKSPCVSG